MKPHSVRGDDWTIEPMIEEPPKPAGRSKDETSRTRSAPAAAHALCSRCHGSKKIGLVRMGKHLVWRVHDRVTMGGVHTHCPASGATLCDSPCRGSEVVTCPHL